MRLARDSEPWIPMLDGKRLHPLAPRKSEIAIESIAYGLAGEHRYGNHTKPRYNVAQHSCLVSDLLIRWGCTWDEALKGLLHDAPEALGFKDLPSPIKRTGELIGYRILEKKMQAFVFRCFDLSEEEPAIVKQADICLLATERRDIIRSSLWDRRLPNPIPEKIKPWPAGKSYAAFLRRYHAIQKKRRSK